MHYHRSTEKVKRSPYTPNILVSVKYVANIENAGSVGRRASDFFFVFQLFFFYFLSFLFFSLLILTYIFSVLFSDSIFILASFALPCFVSQLFHTTDFAFSMNYPGRHSFLSDASTSCHFTFQLRN